MKIHTPRAVRVREELEMPRPPQQRTGLPAYVLVSPDRRTTTYSFEIEDGSYQHTWSLDEGDPRGSYNMRLFVEDRLVGHVTFVVGEPDRRAEGVRILEARMVELDALAREFEDASNSFRTSCSGTFNIDHRPGAQQNNINNGELNRMGKCLSFQHEVEERKNDLDQAVSEAKETARRASVYPGTVRKMLRLHRLEAFGK